MWKLFDYVNDKGENEIKEWTLSLDKRQRIKLNSKLDMLIANGSNLPPQLLAGTGVANIYKLKIQGNPKLRPLLCKGTVDNDSEFTLLVGALEIQWQFEPKNALQIAVKRRRRLLNGKGKRRRHERVK